MAILYKANETDFTHFGLGPLNDAVSILVTEERNGIFELTMEYPISGSQFDELKNDRLIKADAGHNLKDQRFKIIRITKPLKGIVTVYAEHVSYLAQDLALRPRVPFSGNAEQALLSWQDGLVDDNPFIVSSDITTRGNGVWTIDEVENPRRALGGVDGSILDVYGGEYHFNNYQIRLMKQRGVNSATLIAYGRNLVDLTQEEEIANTYTSIYPYSVFTNEDGEQQLVTLPEYYIDSEHVDNFARRKILAVDLTTDEIETEDALRSAANRYITANNVGVPKVNLKIKYLDLAKTLDYKHQAVLEEVNLCDNVPVYFEKFDINTTAKVIKVVWDDLRGHYDSVEIGEARSSLTQSINATVDGKLEKVEKQITNVQLQADGMKLIYRQVEEPPPGENVGDLWYQPDGQYEIMYQWDGSMWKEVLNTRDLESVKRDVDEALEDAKSAKNRANESVEKAELATSNANEAIEQAQGAFDKAQESLEGLETLVSITDEQGKELTTIKGGIDGLQAKVTDAEDNIATLQLASDSFASRIEDAEGNISSISQTAEGLQRRMSDAEGNISSVTELATGMQTRLTDAEGNINTLTQTASSLESTITGVRADLDGLEIGGRNLLQESTSSNLIPASSGKLTNYNDSWSYWTKVESNKTYTISRSNDNNNRFRIVYLDKEPVSGIEYLSIRTRDSYLEDTFTTSSDVTHVLIYLQYDEPVSGDKPNVQLEKGNKATDWSPAPEDVQSQITQLADNINLRVEKGDVINQINISDEDILISGKKLILDGDTTVTGTFRVKDANIESVSADKMTVGTLNGANVNIINLNASNISTGTLIGVDIQGARFYSATHTDYMEVIGGNIELSLSNGRKLDISPTGFYGYNRGGSLRFQADSSLVTSAAFGTSNANVYLATSDGGELRVVRYSSLPGGGSASDYLYRDIRALSYKSPPGRNLYFGTDGEARFMAEGLSATGTYRNVRMGILYSNTHEVRGGVNLYLRTDDRVRIMGTGDSGAYKDLQMAHIQAQSIRKNTAMGGSHFYIGTDLGELRVTGNSLADSGYRDVRARNYYADSGYFESSTTARLVANGGGRVFLHSSVEARVTLPGSNTDYINIRASDFIPSSSEKWKTDIKKYENNALNILKQSVIYQYYKHGSDVLEYGFITERETPSEVKRAEGISSYSLQGLVVKSIQELDTKIDDEVSILQKEKEELVMKVAELEQRINKLESVA